MSWIYLAFAIIFEVCATSFMKLSNGFKNIKYGVAMIFLYILSLSSLTFALKKINIGAAYATWSGIGIILITLVGIILFRDTINFQKIVFIIFIIIGVVGLNLVSTMH